MGFISLLWGWVSWCDAKSQLFRLFKASTSWEQSEIEHATMEILAGFFLLLILLRDITARVRAKSRGGE